MHCSPDFSLFLTVLKRYFLTTFLNFSPTEQYIRKLIELHEGGLGQILFFFKLKYACEVPVDGEEEVVDADGDGVPGGGRVTSTGGSGSTFIMNGAFSEVQDQSRGVGNKEHKDWKGNMFTI